MAFDLIAMPMRGALTGPDVPLRGALTGTDVRARGAALLIAVAMLGMAQGTLAAEPTEDDRNAARESVVRGDTCMREGDLQCALKAYRYADDIMNVPTTSIEVVHVELKLGHLVEAFEACYRTTRHPEKKNEPQPFTKARNEARELIVTLKKRIPRIRIEVRALDSDVVPQVKIDEKVVENYGDAPLNPGAHRATVSAKGHLPAALEFEIAEGDNKTVVVELLREPDKTVIVRAQPASRYWPIAYAGFGVAGAGLIAGSVTGALSLNAAGALAGECRQDGRCPSALEGTLARAIALANASTASFVIAGVGGVVGITGLVLSLRDKRSKPETVVLAPLFDVRAGPAVGMSGVQGWW